ncbi:hypothetical protein EJ05DRAFT_477687 [Pseudovirgaria hyperparasitica]|uniref:Alpha/beta hydrolase fold-3 domain-containing protein n=1 Tax=Pseudovirgaria hyperparasitica TaxID=470096 RepID=A0A6A6W0Y0_9PEZI|nr:uncharacterized protein EJ05DRAFT_477687 [Pseudovirgaria hyperparasitica]KAF2756568.1 hypothetical protein EJ05DRAFT_477687 [Pseudovirgaria hyperparasitica]
MSASSSTTSLPPSSKSSLSKFVSLPFGLQWRTAALRAQRLVPSQVTYLTSPLGPHPITTELPSRGTHKIPVWIFIPPKAKETKEMNAKSKENTKADESASQSGPTRPIPDRKDTKKAKKPLRELGVNLDFHGGGFTTGACTEQAPFCALLARETGRIIITVDYRLGPIDKYPAAVEDAEDVLRAILDQEYEEFTSLPKPQRKAAQALRHELTKEKVSIDRSKLSISGFSSGGNLALGLAVPDSLLTNRLPEGQKVPLLLFYPSLDARLLPHERPLPPTMPVRQESTSSVLTLTTSLMSGMSESYLPAANRGEIKASPGLADPDSVYKYAQILLVNAEWDSLALQGREWAEKMRAKGWTEDRLEMWESTQVKHGWTQFPQSWLVEGEVVERDKVFKRCIEVLNDGSVHSTAQTANKPDAETAAFAKTQAE